MDFGLASVDNRRIVRVAGLVASRAVAGDDRGIGACDPKYDAQGIPAPAQVTLAHQQEDLYDGVLRSVCAAYVHCRWDGDASDDLQLHVADLSTFDYGHPAVSARAKTAAIEWPASFDFTDTSAPVSKARRSGRRVTLSASDAQGVAGIEYRRKAGGAWTRYTKPLLLKRGARLSWRAVDVNGNVEAAHGLTG